MIRIQRLLSYPVKSCRGIEHDSAALATTGLEHDREWMFVAPGGRFITQREAPALARVDVSIADGQLRLSADGVGSVEVPLDLAGPAVEVTVWRDRVPARDQGDAPAAFAAALLGREVRLVRFDPSFRRACDPAWTGGVAASARFSDGFPLLVLSAASLDELNSRLPQPLPLDRFRPNLLLEGLPPHGEDDIADLVTGDVRLRLVKPCTRCVITTTDQQSGQVTGEEPLRTLRTYRWDAALRGVTFGQNAIVIDGAGRRLECGAVVDALPR